MSTDTIARGLGAQGLANSATAGLQWPNLTAISAAGIPANSIRRTSVPIKLTLPSPAAAALISDEMVHPSVIYIPGGWNGYNRWMAITPYPASNSLYENPCILVSNDGENWAPPPGVVNPIVPQFGGTGYYNSDNHLFYHAPTKTMYMMFRWRGTENRLYGMKSTDGKTWTTPVILRTGVISTQDYGAPSFWFNSTTNKWVCLSNNLDNAAYPIQRIETTGPDFFSGWGSPVNVAVTHPTGNTFWHCSHQLLPDGRVLSLMQDGNSGGGNLYLGTSVDDGASITLAPFDLTGGFYRSCFSVLTSLDGSVSGEVYLGKINPWRVLRATCKFDRASVSLDEVRIRGALLFSASNGLSSDLADNFQRADAAVLGSAPSGQTYTVDTGSFGISTKRAYVTTTSNNRALTDLGTGGQDVRLLGRFAVIGTQGWFIFRASDTSNYWRIGVVSGTMKLQKIVSAVVSLDYSLASNVTLGGDRLDVTAKGQTISVILNSEPILSVTDTPISTQTKVGIQAAGAVATYFSEIFAFRI